MNNIKQILIVVVAITIGLTAGYFLFGDEKSNTDQHQHQMDSTANSNKEEIWTCSMDPQVRQNEPGDCPICGMDLIVLDANSSNDPLVLEMTEAAVKLANIQTTTIGMNATESSKAIRLSGKVQIDERSASSQVAHIPGRIEKLFVTYTGEQVRKGQKVATLYSPELISAQRELIEALKLQETNPALVEAARNKLKFWKISQKVIEAIEENGQIQENFTLYADDSGVVTTKRVAVGDHLMQGQPLFDLVNLTKVWVLFDAYEKDLAYISVGDKIDFISPAIPNTTYSTRITFIDPVIDPVTRVASLRTEVNNKKGLLKPEMFVNGKLQKKNTTTNQLFVPKSAVMWTGKRSVAYVKVPDVDIPSYQFREIELGQSLGDSYQLISGLEAGEEVVTNGAFVIDASAQLNNQASMMNKNVQVKKTGTPLALPDYVNSTADKFKEQLTEVIAVYLEMKNAFVETNKEQSAEGAKNLVASLAQVDMKLLENDPHVYWVEQLNAMQFHGRKIMELDDIEEQRKQFDFLSQALIKSVKVFGINDGVLYVQHCPMAFGNQGADWMSKDKNVLNPYFGDKMLTCGVVKLEISKDF